MFHITDKKINIDELICTARDPGAGAQVIFSGEARNLHEGKGVDFLVYEAHVEMAEKSIEAILNRAKERWSLKNAVAIHRIGKVEISEPAVVVITASAHRKEAYEANQFIIDEIKRESPIWKKEFFSNGQNSWL